MSDLPAGRELDALVATKVMGFARTEQMPHEVFAAIRDDGQKVLLKRYSTDIAAAWRVWDLITGREPWKWAIYADADGEVTVEHYPDDYTGDREAGAGDFACEGPAPLAICRAALRAVVP